jgi:hypothetical protein
MGVQERFESLEPRERRLVLLLVGIGFVMAVMLVPVGVSALLSEKTERNAVLKAAIERIALEGDEIRERQARHEALLARYETPAPALAGFLDKAASASGVEIPEVGDQSVVTHGKRYEERYVSIPLRKVGLVGLVKFMERVSGGTEPTSISKLNIRKRGVTPDTYDVQMTVSSFVRVAAKDKTDSEAEGQ